MSDAGTDDDVAGNTDAETGRTDDATVTAADAAATGTADGPAAFLERVRTDRQPHLVALAVAVLVGIAAAWTHWLGLVLGGALVALVAPSVRRGVLAALGFGVLVLVAFAASLGGDAAQLPAMTPVVYVAVGAALGLPLFGSLARALG